MPNTNQLPPEIQEIREVVARLFCAAQEGDDWAYLTDGQRTFCYGYADQLFSILSKHGVVVLSKDQTPPEIPPVRFSALLKQTQANVIGAGFRKVVNLDGTVKER